MVLLLWVNKTICIPSKGDCIRLANVAIVLLIYVENRYFIHTKMADHDRENLLFLSQIEKSISQQLSFFINRDLVYYKHLHMHIN